MLQMHVLLKYVLTCAKRGVTEGLSNEDRKLFEDLKTVNEVQ